MLLGMGAAVFGSGVTPRVAAADDVEPYARVIVDTAIIRSGPAASYQRVYVAQRGEVFPVVSRATRGGYWFQVELPDATKGWILGDVVYVHEVSDEEATGGRFLPWLFAPPPLPTASGELAVTGGVLGQGFGFGDGGVGGFLAVRPTIYIQPTFGIEFTLAASVSDGGRLFMGTVGGIVNIFPRSPIVPYLVAGGGYNRADPNADTFLLQEGDTGLLYGGGGLRFGFRYRLTLRIEARAWLFVTPNLYVAQEELSAGITVFF
ncbi:MAG: SH3 domain-containing protein [Myxococcota bacterium]